MHIPTALSAAALLIAATFVGPANAASGPGNLVHMHLPQGAVIQIDDDDDDGRTKARRPVPSQPRSGSDDDDDDGVRRSIRRDDLKNGGIPKSTPRPRHRSGDDDDDD